MIEFEVSVEVGSTPTDLSARAIARSNGFEIFTRPERIAVAALTKEAARRRNVE